MTLEDWTIQNERSFGSPFEELFVKSVLPLVSGLRLNALSVQYPFYDSDRRQRYCDFVIREGDHVRIAIEIDGFDKAGTGQGMTHDDFVDWQRRQSALTSQGWYVLRFANRDVRDRPQRCADEISLLLERLRNSHGGTAPPDPVAPLPLRKKPEDRSRGRRWAAAKKYSVNAMYAVALTLLVFALWQKSQGPSPQPEAEQLAPTSSAETTGAKVEPSTIPVAQPVPAREPRARTATMGSIGVGRDRAEEIPEGGSCGNPISWLAAGGHVGETVSVEGPLVKVTHRQDIRGGPTWVDIGSVYPDNRRVVLVIWENQKPKFPMINDGLKMQNVCVTGKIALYKGTPEIELRTAEQLTFIK